MKFSLLSVNLECSAGNYIDDITKTCKKCVDGTYQPLSSQVRTFNYTELPPTNVQSLIFLISHFKYKYHKTKVKSPAKWPK